MNKFATKSLCFILVLGLGAADLRAQQPVDGENSYRLSAVNERFLTAPDTITCSSGRGVFVADDPDLDGDGKPEILVTEYSNGGRVHVFEVAGNDLLEHVWSSKKLAASIATGGSGSTPRSVSVGDLDNNGMMEIHFSIGDAAADTLRGHYIYEFTGTDDDYGVEPIRVVKFEEIDPLFANANIGRSENPLTIEDIDGDNKTELLFTPRSFGNLDTGNLYILEVESGTFSGGDASIRVEFKYTGMARVLDFGEDGYTPVNTAVGDIDNDNIDEIVVLGWTNINAGGGAGFLEISGPDTYTEGSVIQISDASIFVVKGNVEIVDVDGSKGVIIAGMASGSIDRKIWAIDNIVSEAFISASDLQVLVDGVAAWGIIDIGDQDHGSGSDGFNIYASRSNDIVDIEHNGTGAISDPNSYTNNGRLGQFNLDEAYDVSDGLFDAIHTYPGMDIDADGNRDIVVSYKGACGEAGDVLEGAPFRENNFGVFVFEWGDSTQSIPLTLATSVEERPGFTIITPDDYQLEQNFPNPFNPETNIQFSLPVNKTVSLKIYNSRGQEVRTLVNNEALSQGTHTVLWNATDDQGNAVASGVYIYRLIFGNFSKSQTMTLVR
jgi:hypothetical protein